MNSESPLQTGTLEKSWVKWEVLLLLWMAYLLNQGDRQVFNTVLPSIREALSLTDTSVGLIATIFNLFYAFMVPLGGWAGDRFSRKWVVTISILFWSVATMFTGLANGVFLLVMMRSVATGGGEAFFGPANYSLLGQYHTDTRARAMSIHQTAYYVGVILAGWLAGAIADYFDTLNPGNGWKYSFIIFGAAGIIWGILMAVRLKDKPLSKEEIAARDAARPGILDGFKTVFTTPTAAVLTIGFSGLIFVITGYMTWIPAFLQEELGQSQAAAGFNSMFWTYVAAFIGVLIAGGLSDRLARRHHRSRMILQALGLIGGALPLLFMSHSKVLWVLYLCFAVWGFFRAFFDANTYAVLYDVTPEPLHASCSSAMITTGFAVGALAPVVLGAMKQSLGSLQATFPVLGIIWLVCGVLMAVVSYTHYQKDYDKMNNR
ncbi:MAG: MFS transporter [Candidatus Cryptobacteroides sp.]|nr:MFS transporter [Bacteroidales bacterium]MDY3226457.1 MFS transporter [Candidatus Cryptobacteroides sp.]MDD7155418.1 MFS transporter [Bacteroidales bacterium]MDY4572864.1 MFS transporter [Candidatus Cryptobacteroides sp.]MDY5442233.1 MFS transporter [Candidatus Cryptobacteroides sp.]